MKKITIVGGGLVGALQAVFMAKRGYQVDVYERRPDLRQADINAGKSINLVISHRGWNALKAAGIAEEIEKITVPVYGRMTHDVDGNQEFYPYSVMGNPIHSVSRGELNCALMDCAEQFENVNFHFDHKCVDVNLNQGTCVFEFDEQQISISADLVIGTDGAFSAVRGAMVKTDRFNYSQEYIAHGYKEIHIPPGANGKPQMQLDALHIWPRKDFMLMGLANTNGGFTGTLFMPFEGEPWSFEKIVTEDEVRNFFGQVFPDAVPLIPDYVEQYFGNPTSSLAIIRCAPWHYGNNIMLMGDAAHAIIPFYGEGANCGFEDCFVFEQLLDKYGDENMGEVLNEYTRLRKDNGNAIADLSKRNFIEMRDLVADPQFILRKKIEGHFYKNHPDKWIPLYSQVKFTNTPYADAKQQGEHHDAIMESILAMPGIENKWDSEEVEKAILSQL